MIMKLKLAYKEALGKQIAKISILISILYLVVMNPM